MIINYNNNKIYNMKHLTDYINEKLDDNIFWKIDTYFQKNPD